MEGSARELDKPPDAARLGLALLGAQLLVVALHPAALLAEARRLDVVLVGVRKVAPTLEVEPKVVESDDGVKRRVLGAKERALRQIRPARVALENGPEDAVEVTVRAWVEVLWRQRVVEVVERVKVTPPLLIREQLEGLGDRLEHLVVAIFLGAFRQLGLHVVLLGLVAAAALEASVRLVGVVLQHCPTVGLLDVIGRGAPTHVVEIEQFVRVALGERSLQLRLCLRRLLRGLLPGVAIIVTIAIVPVRDGNNERLIADDPRLGG